MGFYHQIDRAFRLKFSYHPILWQNLPPHHFPKRPQSSLKSHQSLHTQSLCRPLPATTWEISGVRTEWKYVQGIWDKWTNGIYVCLYIYIYNFFNGSILWDMTMGIFYRMRHDFLRYHDMEYGWIFLMGIKGVQLLELSHVSPWGPPNYGNVEREMYNKPSIFAVFLPYNPCLHWVYTFFCYIDC